MSNPLALPLHVLGLPSTANGTGDAIDIGALRTACELTLSAYAVTGTLTAYIETSPDNTPSSHWHQVTQVDVAEANSSQKLTLGQLQRYLRVRWTVSGGSPSVAWSLDGDAHVIYFEPSDIAKYAIPPEALAGIEDATLIADCITISSEADGYLNGSFELPLAAWGQSLRKHCAALAAAMLFRRRGCDPQGPDKLVFDSEATSISWFKMIANGRMKPPEIIDSTPEAFEGGSVVVSNPSRGW